MVLLLGSGLFQPLFADSQPTFDVWLQGVREEALREGISANTLDLALAHLKPLDRVIELDRRQPEFTQTFWSYLDARITDWRIQYGKEMLQKHRKLLSQVEAQYGVPARYLVAFWGMETNYGNYLGKFSTVESLATLAYDPRRSDFFRSQLIDALRIIDQGHITPEKMLGSWAGAVGHLQFMPTTFLKYATDGDEDQRIDVWGDLEDVFASGANYLNKIGWKYGELWGREVRLPKDFEWQLASLKIHQPVAEWRARGVTKADGRPLPDDNITYGSIVLPQGAQGPAFLVYHNFNVIMDWNLSINYAVAVGHLADRLIDMPPLRNGREADNRPLSFEAAKEMQGYLNQLGFDVGEPDGVAGRNTRSGIRAYQAAMGLPVDGFASVTLLEQLRDSVSVVAE